MKPDVPDSIISPPPETGHELDMATKATTVENNGVKRVLNDDGNEPAADEPADTANVGDGLATYTPRSHSAPSDPALEIPPICSAETDAYQRMTKRQKGSISAGIGDDGLAPSL